jgi:hypothetical protein
MDSLDFSGFWDSKGFTLWTGYKCYGFFGSHGLFISFQRKINSYNYHSDNLLYSCSETLRVIASSFV